MLRPCDVDFFLHRSELLAAQSEATRVKEEYVRLRETTQTEKRVALEQAKVLCFAAAAAMFGLLSHTMVSRLVELPNVPLQTLQQDLKVSQINVSK